MGGLAVGANGFPRATKDVAFLVGDEAFERHPGGLVTFRPGVPFHKDRTDVIELVKAGLDVESCRDYLAAHAPSFVADFEDAVRRARAEDE